MAKQNLASMSMEALLDLREQVIKALSRKGDELRQQIEKLSWDNGNAQRLGRPPGKKAAANGHALKGRKVAPKYRSKADRKLTWSGRGAMPRWMVAEMKGTKLKKDDFAI
jgi:DNA-binding protein H-NS